MTRAIQLCSSVVLYAPKRKKEQTINGVSGKNREDIETLTREAARFKAV